MRSKSQKSRIWACQMSDLRSRSSITLWIRRKIILTTAKVPTIWKHSGCYASLLRWKITRMKRWIYRSEVCGWSQTTSSTTTTPTSKAARISHQRNREHPCTAKNSSSPIACSRSIRYLCSFKLAVSLANKITKVPSSLCFTRNSLRNDKHY